MAQQHCGTGWYHNHQGNDQQPAKKEKGNDQQTETTFSQLH
jgi:hypothetical protein